MDLLILTWLSNAPVSFCVSAALGEEREAMIIVANRINTVANQQCLRIRSAALKF